MGPEAFKEQFRELYANKAVSGIILSVNSGGGYSDAGDVLYNAIADRNKPVIIHTIFMGSAALKGTLKADEIIAATEGTQVGSIGTMLTMPKWYLEEAREGEIELYSRNSPRKNEAWRAMKNGDFEPFIDQLTENDKVFMRMVSRERPLKGSEEYIEETLSGAVFMANSARRRGLIDGVGGLNYALRRAQSIINQTT